MLAVPNISCGTVTFAAVLYRSRKFRGNNNYETKNFIMEVWELRFVNN